MSTRITRRKALALFINLIGVTWAVGLTALTGLYTTSNIRLRKDEKEHLLGDLTIYSEAFRPVRMRVSVDDGWYRRVDEQMVYIRSNPDDPAHPIVLSAKCSHLGCTVGWDKEKGEFVCPCHGGRFGDDGAVLSGPPPTGLTRIPAELRGGDVYLRLT